MSAHDDFMDVRDAYRRYEKAYEAWGRAVDGKMVDPKNILAGLHPASPEAVQLAQSTRMVKALDYIIQCAQEAKKGHAMRGWPKPGTPKAKRKKNERRFV